MAKSQIPTITTQEDRRRILISKQTWFVGCIIASDMILCIFTYLDLTYLEE